MVSLSPTITLRGYYYLLPEFGRCTTGWKDFGQFCYQFNLDKKSWSDAQVACVNQQGELVSIHSPVEQALVALQTGPLGLDADAWIGRFPRFPLIALVC